MGGMKSKERTKAAGSCVGGQKSKDNDYNTLCLQKAHRPPIHRQHTTNSYVLYIIALYSFLFASQKDRFPLFVRPSRLLYHNYLRFRDHSSCKEEGHIVLIEILRPFLIYDKYYLNETDKVSSDQCWCLDRDRPSIDHSSIFF